MAESAERHQQTTEHADESRLGTAYDALTRPRPRGGRAQRRDGPAHRGPTCKSAPPTLRLRGMGSSKSRLLPSGSSRASSGCPVTAGMRKGLKLSADRGGDGVDGFDWSLGMLQLQYPLLLWLDGVKLPASFQDPFEPSARKARYSHLHPGEAFLMSSLEYKRKVIVTWTVVMS